MNKKCQMNQCEREGEWMPILEFRAGENKPPAPCALGLPICTFHKERSTVEDFLSDEGFKQVCDTMRAHGYEQPVRSLTSLRWVKPQET